MSSAVYLQAEARSERLVGRKWLVGSAGAEVPLESSHTQNGQCSAHITEPHAVCCTIAEQPKKFQSTHMSISSTVRMSSSVSNCRKLGRKGKRC